MAFGSYYFRKEIKKDISFLRKKTNTDIAPLSDAKLDEIFSKVEIKLFMIAFSVRKLLETRRLPDSVAVKTIRVTSYPRNQRRRGPYFDFEKLYELERPSTVSLRLEYVLNQFIHSFVFQAAPNTRRRLAYIYLSSDRIRDRHLYRVRIKTFLNFIDQILKHEAKQMSIIYDDERGDYVVKVK